MKKNRLLTKDILKVFEMEIVNVKEADVNKEIGAPAIHRKGLQLAGVHVSSKVDTTKTIVGWGTKEQVFLSGLSHKKAEDAIMNVITENTPLILLSVGVQPEIRKLIVNCANKYKIPVADTKLHLSVLTTTISSYLVRFFAEQKGVHASLVIVNGVGVMITGKSGIGKSEAVLELIQGGHSFVSDDTVILKRIGRRFFGYPAEITKGLLEARGIGLINIPHIYGMRAVKSSAQVELVLELISSEDLKEPDRLGIKELKYKVLGSHIALMQIPVNKGRTVASLIEAATNVYLAKKDGQDALKIIETRSEK